MPHPKLRDETTHRLRYVFEVKLSEKIRRENGVLVVFETHLQSVQYGSCDKKVQSQQGGLNAP